MDSPRTLGSEPDHAEVHDDHAWMGRGSRLAGSRGADTDPGRPGRSYAEASGRPLSSSPGRSPSRASGPFPTGVTPSDAGQCSDPRQGDRGFTRRPVAAAEDDAAGINSGINL